eukprot:1567696-Lingulodinium_polyedra.AAC.1
MSPPRSAKEAASRLRSSWLPAARLCDGRCAWPTLCLLGSFGSRALMWYIARGASRSRQTSGLS